MNKNNINNNNKNIRKLKSNNSVTSDKKTTIVKNKSTTNQRISQSNNPKSNESFSLRNPSTIQQTKSSAIHTNNNKTVFKQQQSNEIEVNTKNNLNPIDVNTMEGTTYNEEKWDDNSYLSNSAQAQDNDGSTTENKSAIPKSNAASIRNSRTSKGSKYGSSSRKKLNSSKRKSAHTYHRKSIPIANDTDAYFPSWKSDTETMAPKLLEDILKYKVYDYPIKLQNEEDIKQWRKAYDLRNKMKQYDLHTRKRLYESNMINPKAKFTREKYVFLNKIPEHRSAFPIPKDATDVQKCNVIQTYLKTHAAFILSEKLSGKKNKGALNYADQMKIMKALNNPLINFIGSDKYDKLKLGNNKNTKSKSKNRLKKPRNTSGLYKSKPLGMYSTPFSNPKNDNLGKLKKNNTRNTISEYGRNRSSKPVSKSKQDHNRRSVQPGRSNKLDKGGNAKRDTTKHAGHRKASVPSALEMKSRKGGYPKNANKMNQRNEPNNKYLYPGNKEKKEKPDLANYNFDYSFDGRNMNNQKHVSARDPSYDRSSSSYEENLKREDSYGEKKRRDPDYDDYKRISSYGCSYSNSRSGMSDNSTYVSSSINNENLENQYRNNHFNNIYGSNQFNMIPQISTIHTPTGAAIIQNVNGINVIEKPGVMNVIEIPSNIITPPAVYEQPVCMGNVGYMNLVNIPEPMYNCYSDQYTLNYNQYPSNMMSGMPNKNNPYNPNITDMEDNDYRNKQYRNISYDSSDCSSFTNESTVTESMSASSTGSSSYRSDMDFNENMHKDDTFHTKQMEDKYKIEGNIKSKRNEDMKLRMYLKHL